MRLIDAYNLLVEDGISDNHRYFSELYKQFNYRDEGLLKDYLEFIYYDPVEWMRGFPKKLTTKTSFSKPKTAVIKLLKKEAVVEAVGAEFAERLHTKIWKTFKENSEGLLADRAKTKKGGSASSSGNSSGSASGSSNNKAPTMTVMDHFDAAELDADAESLHSYEELPIPDRSVGTVAATIPTRTPSLHISSPPTSPSLIASVAVEEDSLHHTSSEERIRLLKEVLRSMAKTLPDGVSDAFVALVEAV